MFQKLNLGGFLMVLKINLLNMILPKSRTVGLRFVWAGLLEFHVLKLILVKKEEKRTDLSESSIRTKF